LGNLLSGPSGDGGVGTITESSGGSGMSVSDSSGGSSSNGNGGSSMSVSESSGGSSMSVSESSGGSGVSDSSMGSNGNGGSSGYGNGSSGNSVVGSGVGCVMDNGLLNNLVDGVNLVGGGHRDGTGNLNLVGLGNVLLDNDLTRNSDGDLDGYINVVFVDLELGHDVGLDRGDSGVSSHGSEDSLLGNGISGGGAEVDGCWGDGGIWGRDNGEGWGRESLGLNNGLGLAGDVAGGRLGNDLLVGLHVLVTGLNALGANLDGLVANNAILHMFLDDGGTGGVSVVGLADGNGGADS